MTDPAVRSAMPPPASVAPHPDAYLPRPAFQLKYTAVLVGISLLLMLGLGVAIERITDVAARAADSAVDQAARAMESSQNSSRVVRLSEIERAADDPELVRALERELTLIDQEAAHNTERIRAERQHVAQVRSRTLIALSTAAVLLALALAAVGILATRQIVAPMIRLKRLLRKVARGKLDIRERLHATDELSELFNVFMEMVDSLKRTQAREIGDLTVAIKEAESAGTAIEVIQRLRDLRDSMEVTLQPPDVTIRISAAQVRAMTDKIK